MSQLPEFYCSLAEAISPLSHSLAAGLLIRPVPSGVGLYPGASMQGVSMTALCLDLDAMLEENVPAMRAAMAELGKGSFETLEEVVDELATPALELVDMARRIWEAPFSPEAEEVRSILATLAEAPVTQLLQWVLEVMHLAIDPWSIAEDPKLPGIDFDFVVPDAPVREALKLWRANHPGILPENIL